MKLLSYVKKKLIRMHDYVAVLHKKYLSHMLTTHFRPNLEDSDFQ